MDLFYIVSLKSVLVCFLCFLFGVGCQKQGTAPLVRPGTEAFCSEIETFSFETDSFRLFWTKLG